MQESHGMASYEMAKLTPAQFVGLDAQPSVLEIMKRRRTVLAAQLDDIDAAISSLEGNPEMAKLLETVARASRYL